MSPLFHFAPHWVHVAGVAFNHLCEVVAPFLVFGPRICRHVAGVLLVTFQVALILSGNLSFLNWLTLIPVLACFDDAFWRRLIPGRWSEWVSQRTLPRPKQVHQVAAGVFALVVAALSVPAVANLLSSEQRMNTSHEPIELVNSYGAFGSVGKVRHEILFEGTDDPEPGERTVWKAYEFPCKPGDPARRPCLISPYHYRLDWQVWFAAMEGPEDEPWFVHLVWKLLHNDPGALSLLANNPFPNAPPRFIRAGLYRYDYAPRGSPAWWTRTYVGPWLPAVSADDSRLREFLDAFHWNDR